MSNIYISNLSGSNIIAGAVTIPPGSWMVPNTSEFRGTWNDGTNMSISEGKSYHVATFGALPTVEEIDSTVGNFESLMIGFALVFTISLTALGARWVRKIIGGGLNE